MASLVTNPNVGVPDDLYALLRRRASRPDRRAKPGRQRAPRAAARQPHRRPAGDRRRDRRGARAPAGRETLMVASTQAGESQPALAYQAGFGNEFATEALAGALPRRAELAAARRRTASTPSRSPAPRSPRRAHDNRRSWLYRIRPAAMHEPFEPHRRRRASHSRFDEVADVAEPAALGSAAAADGADRFRRRPASRWPATAAPATQTGCGDPPVRGQPLDAGPLLLRRRRRAADRAAAGPAAHRHRARRARRRAAGDRRDPARHALPRRAARRRRRAATSARTSARRCACPTSVRSARTASPIRAIS